MEKSKLRIFSLLLVVLPMFSMAQTNIKKSFQSLLSCSDVQVTDSHSLTRDPETGEKTGQLDFYSFVLPKNKVGLINNIVAAFDKDARQAYSLNSGYSRGNQNTELLAVGDGSGQGIVTNPPDSDYIYALFLAPKEEDPSGIYRYAYALNYREENGQITGNLIVTYATTLKYRQQLDLGRQMQVQNFPNGVTVYQPKVSWFDNLMKYLQGMTSESTQMRIALANKAYKVITEIGQYDVTEQDKSTAREVLKAMIADKKYSDSILNTLLQQCLSGIK